ncbi:MAG: hypothetical protein OSB62_08475 [Alphaproteobacteria bacterium]|nr:hypothetical protein [Alphaproteobacteria bacterium]
MTSRSNWRKTAEQKAAEEKVARFEFIHKALSHIKKYDKMISAEVTVH